MRLFGIIGPHLGVDEAGADTVDACTFAPVVGERLAEVNDGSCQQDVSRSLQDWNEHVYIPFAAL